MTNVIYNHRRTDRIYSQYNLLKNSYNTLKVSINTYRLKRYNNSR